MVLRCTRSSRAASAIVSSCGMSTSARTGVAVKGLLWPCDESMQTCGAESARLAFTTRAVLDI